jgi:hypothetical protein
MRPARTHQSGFCRYLVARTHHQPNRGNLAGLRHKSKLILDESKQAVDLILALASATSHRSNQRATRASIGAPLPSVDVELNEQCLARRAVEMRV